MSNVPATDYRSRKLCTQPGCLLRRTGFSAEHLAGILIQLLSGKSMESLIGASERISARPQCVDCALRVMQGGKAFLSGAEWGHLDELGNWHYRRERRRQRWGYQPH